MIIAEIIYCNLYAFYLIFDKLEINHLKMNYMKEIELETYLR